MTMVASTSMAAYHSIDLTELEEEVLKMIRGFGPRGCTVDEILNEYKIDYRTLSPRFAPLERKGSIFRAGDTRPGNTKRQQKVMRAAEYAGHPLVPVIKPKRNKKNPFLEGMVFAAKTILKHSDFRDAKLALKEELEKVAKR